MRVALVALFVVALSASIAGAHSNGTVFSSAVDGDSAAMFWNPAAMSLSTTSRFDLVVNFDMLQGSYQRFGTDDQQGGRPYPKVSIVEPKPEPVIGVVIDKLWHERLRLGFDITLPTVTGAGWPEKVDDHGQEVLGPTRYHVTSAQIFSIYAQLGASIAVHRTFAIGAAVNIDISRIDARKDVDLANQPPLRDMVSCSQNPLGCESPGLSAPIHFVGTGASAGATVGALWRPIDRLRIGAAYLSPVKVTVPLTLTIDSTKLSNFAKQFLPSYGTVPVNGKGHAHLVVPQRVHLAIAGDVTKAIELMAMFTWENDAQAEVISGAVTTRSNALVPSAIAIPSVKNDTFQVMARIVGRVKDRALIGFLVEYQTHGVPNAFMSPANLDFDNLTLSLGARGRLGKGVWLGATVGQTIVWSRTITASAYGNDAPVPYNLPDPSGKYTGNAERVGLDVSYAF